MLLLASTTDKIQVVTGQASSIDVRADWVDYVSPSTVTPGRTNTATISTATTTDVVASPAASTIRNVKSLFVRNRHASVACTVTVKHTDGTNNLEIIIVVLNPGEALHFVEGKGFTHYDSSGYEVAKNTSLPVLANANVADVVANAADTYLTDSSLIVGGRWQAGTFIRWRLTATKTAAGVATPIFNIRFGTLGTVAGDTARCTATGVAQTAAVDTGWFEIEAVVRSIGASGVVVGIFRLAHKLATTGIANVAQDQIFQAVSAGFDNSASNLICGLSVNPGAAGVWTFQTISVRAFDVKG